MFERFCALASFCYFCIRIVLSCFHVVYIMVVKCNIYSCVVFNHLHMSILRKC